MAVNKKLVVLGAGVGGLSVVKELRESGVPLDDLDLTIIDEDFSHFLGFTLPWVMRGWRTKDSVPIRPSIESLSGLTAVTGVVQGIDVEARTVTLADATRVAFDALVIATGSRNVVEKVPGLSRAMDEGIAVHYYDANAAEHAHRAIREFVGGKLVFLVTSQPYRCPVAPYEGALLAADLLKEMGTRAATQISIYSPEAHPMPSAGPYAGPELVALLNGSDIEFRGNCNIASIDADSRVLRFRDGDSVEFDLLVFVPPHEPALTLDDKTWIDVDAATMETRHRGIFAIGDATAVSTTPGRSLPKAAIFAKNGAKAAADNVLRYLGMVDHADALSGEGYCYIDTGSGASARGAGDFFAQPHPDIHLTTPSAELNHRKQQEEHDWRALWG